MDEKKVIQRNCNFDILRILAAFFVVMCHVSANYLWSENVYTEKYIVSHMLNAIGHTGSVIFLFLSGALLLADEYHFKAKKFYLNNFLKLLVAYEAWVILYNVIGVIKGGNFGFIYWKDVIINAIAGKACYHFWYLPVLLGIYLILPMLRSICKDKKNVVLYFIILFVVIQIVFRTILLFEFPYKYLVEYLMNRIPYTLVNHYVGYFVMGYYLNWIVKEKKLKKQSLIGGCLLIGGLVLGLVSDFFLSYQQGTTVASLNDIFTLSTLCIAVGVFLLLTGKTIVLNQTLEKLVPGISKLTFGIYMIHPLFLEVFLKKVEFFDGVPKIVVIPVLTLLVFCISMLVIWMFSKVPIVNEWLLFCGKSRKKNTT